MKQKAMEMPGQSRTEQLVETIRRKNKTGERLTPEEQSFVLSQREADRREDNPYTR